MGASNVDAILDGANVVSSVTPVGFEIQYCPEPRWYKIDGVEVPSVTHVLDVLHKPALTWWGMKVGVEGVLDLLERAEVRPDANEGGYMLMPRNELGTWLGTDGMVSLLTQHKLTVNHIRDSAARRGISVHDAFELWCQGQDIPDPSHFPEEERGYVQGLIRFIEGVEPQPIYTELMVASKEHGFAGRLDLMADTVAKEVQTGPRTKRKIPNGRGILDLKTSKDAYPSHHIQLGAYRGAAEESGYGRSEYEAVVLVKADGGYDFKLSRGTYEDFLGVLRVYTALEQLKKRR